MPTPAPGQSQQSLWGDPDKLELDEARREAARAYNDPNNVLSHSNNYIPIRQVTKPEEHPLYERHRKLVEEVWPTLTPQQRQQYGPARRQMEDRMNADLKAQNLEVRKRHEEELKKTDAKWEDANEREKNAAVIGGHVDTKAAETEAWSKHKDPVIRLQHDFDLKVGPLTTMRRLKPDGTFDLVPLRDATNTIVMLNGGLSNEQALQHALRLGSPVGFDDKTGAPLPGYNGRKGLGAANYKVIGRDVRNNVVVEMNDGTKLRMPPQVLDTFVDARKRGYEEAKKWEKDRKAAGEPGLVCRTFNRVRDAIK